MSDLPTEVNPILWTVGVSVESVASLGAWPAIPLQRVLRGHETGCGFGFLLVLVCSEFLSTEI